MSGERLNILTGNFEAPRTPVVTPAPTPDPVTERFNVLAEKMDKTLEFLALDPAERARQEAAPLIEQERALTAQERTAREAAERRAETISAEATTVLSAQQEGAQRLRDMLFTKEEETGRLRAETEQLRETSSQLQAENVRLTQALAVVPPAQRPVVSQPPVPVNPADIQFVYQRHENGLLRHVVLRANGFNDVTIDIDRGPDNRMRKLKVR